MFLAGRRILSVLLSAFFLLAAGLAAESETPKGSSRGSDPRQGMAAVTVEVVPSATMVSAGTPFTVDVVVSGLGNMASPSVGAFDFNLAFDSAIVSFTGISFGNLLGDEGMGEATTGSVPMAGSVDAFEVSLLLPVELNALQPDSFALYTLNFDSLAQGASTLDIELNAPVGDEFGIALQSLLIDSSIDVGAAQAVSDIPTLSEWGMMLLAAALLLVGLSRIRRVAS